MVKRLLHITVPHATNLYKSEFISALVFPSVPSTLVTSTSLSLSAPTVTIGSSTNFTCTALLSMDVSGALIKFDYGSTSNTVTAVAGVTQTDIATMFSITPLSAGEHTCIVTVTASGVCGGGGSEPACPTKTSDSVKLTVQCEW